MSTRGAVARTLTAGTDYALQLVFNGSSVSVTIDGVFVLSFAYNAVAVDGAVGTLSRSGTTSFDSFRIKTDDLAFPRSNGH